MNMKDIERLQKEGKIRGFKAPPVTAPPAGLPKGPSSMPKTKAAFKMALEYLCKDYGLPLFHEQMFHGKRKWRFDFLIPWVDINGKSSPLALEYEGLISDKSGHTTIRGFTDNTDKYREAALAGIIVLRYTALNYTQATNDLKMFFLTKK